MGQHDPKNDATHTTDKNWDQLMTQKWIFTIFTLLLQMFTLSTFFFILFQFPNILIPCQPLCSRQRTTNQPSSWKYLIIGFVSE